MANITLLLQLDFDLEQELANSTCVHLADHYSKQLDLLFHPFTCKVCRVASGSLMSLFLDVHFRPEQNRKVAEKIAECVLSLDSSVLALHSRNKQKSTDCMLEILNSQDIPISPKFIGTCIATLPYYLNFNPVQTPTLSLQIANPSQTISEFFERSYHHVMETVTSNTTVTSAEWKSIKQSHMVPNTAIELAAVLRKISNGLPCMALLMWLPLFLHSQEQPFARTFRGSRLHYGGYD